MHLEHYGLYVVMTDPVVGYEACAQAAVYAGVQMLQLRMKNTSRQEMLTVARSVCEITRGSPTRFIVNDDVEVALAVDADGVHLGQDDMPIPEARARWNAPGKIFGWSTHNEAQQKLAEVVQPDYIGIGPVYATPTKDIPDPVIGIERLNAMLKTCALPHVCIGGINLDNLEPVLQAGAKNLCAVRPIMRSANPGELMREFQLRAKRFGAVSHTESHTAKRVHPN